LIYRAGGVTLFNALVVGIVSVNITISRILSNITFFGQHFVVVDSIGLTSTGLTLSCPKATEFGEMTQNNGHYSYTYKAIHCHRSMLLIENPYMQLSISE